MGWTVWLSHYRPLHVSSRPGGKAKTLSHNFIQALKTHSSLGGALFHQTPSIKQTTYEVGVLVENTWWYVLQLRGPQWGHPLDVTLGGCLGKWWGSIMEVGRIIFCWEMVMVGSSQFVPLQVMNIRVQPCNKHLRKPICWWRWRGEEGGVY